MTYGSLICVWCAACCESINAIARGHIFPYLILVYFLEFMFYCKLLWHIAIFCSGQNIVWKYFVGPLVMIRQKIGKWSIPWFNGIIFFKYLFQMRYYAINGNAYSEALIQMHNHNLCNANASALIHSTA